ncbi:MAG: response regulator transcription factor [Elusimicrobiota bacterium]|jgi:DNA-binding response OmpR family regulator
MAGAVKSKVLIIDDNLCYGRMLCRTLQFRDLDAVHVATGVQGLARAKSSHPDLILLDIHLPDTDGIQLYRSLRQEHETRNIPIILMTGVGVIDSLLDTAVGALKSDPVYRKVEGMPVLLARIAKTLNPAQPSDAEAGAPPGYAVRVLSRGPLTVDLVSRRVCIQDKVLPALPIRRFDLLCALLRHKGAVSREELLMDVWGDHHDPKVVDMTISRLRHDLRCARAVSIETTRHGYELVVTAAA